MTPKEYFSNGIVYDVLLMESIFKQLVDCEALTYWAEGGTGTPALEDTDPVPMEGYFCITDTLAADDVHDLTFTSPDLIDLTNFDYIAFWVRLSNVANLSTFTFTIIDDDGDSVEFDLSTEVLAADTWYRVIIHKEEMIETGTMDWSIVEAFQFETLFDANGNYVLSIDDLGVYE